MILMKHSLDREKGVTFLGILFIAIVVVFSALILIRIIPPYIDFYQVKDSLEIIAKDPGAAQMGKARLREMFSRRMHMNNINNIDPNKLEIVNDKGKTKLVIKYETRVHVMGNLDAVINFESQAMVE